MKDRDKKKTSFYPKAYCSKLTKVNRKNTTLLLMKSIKNQNRRCLPPIVQFFKLGYQDFGQLVDDDEDFNLTNKYKFSKTFYKMIMKERDRKRQAFIPKHFAHN